MTTDGNLFAARHAGNGGLAVRAIGSEAVATRPGSRWMKSGGGHDWPVDTNLPFGDTIELWLLQLAATENAITETLA